MSDCEQLKWMESLTSLTKLPYTLTKKVLLGSIQNLVVLWTRYKKRFLINAVPPGFFNLAITFSHIFCKSTIKTVKSQQYDHIQRSDNCNTKRLAILTNQHTFTALKQFNQTTRQQTFLFRNSVNSSSFKIKIGPYFSGSHRISLF